MEALTKVVMPCRVDVGSAVLARAFAKIEFDGRRLSISGVVGPRRDGDCSGSAGQCVESFRSGIPADGWTQEMLDRFCDIWERWHLNDMRPCCEHQKALGWDELAERKVKFFRYKLTPNALKARSAAVRSAEEALRAGRTFCPTPEQTLFANLSYMVMVPEGEEPECRALYNLDDDSKVYGPAYEYKRLGWLTQKEYKDGILCRPCPVCGYRYGTAWKYEPIPQYVIGWLSVLPDSPVDPAWV